MPRGKTFLSWNSPSSGSYCSLLRLPWGVSMMTFSAPVSESQASSWKKFIVSFATPFVRLTRGWLIGPMKMYGSP